MPPKKSKSKMSKRPSNWDIALAHVGEDFIKRKAHLQGRIDEHAALYDSPGWGMEVRYLNRDPKDENKHVVGNQPEFAPHPDHKYGQVGHIKTVLGKVGYAGKDAFYKIDPEPLLKLANEILVGDELTMDLDAAGVGSRQKEIYRATLRRLPGEKK
jgi:hypothetical protein